MIFEALKNADDPGIRGKLIAIDNLAERVETVDEDSIEVETYSKSFLGFVGVLIMACGLVLLAVLFTHAWAHDNDYVTASPSMFPSTQCLPDAFDITPIAKRLGVPPSTAPLGSSGWVHNCDGNSYNLTRLINAFLDQAGIRPFVGDNTSGVLNAPHLEPPIGSFKPVEKR